MPVAPAGHDAEVLRTEAHDREVGLEAASFVEQGGVDDPADGDVHLRDGEGLQAGQGARDR